MSRRDIGVAVAELHLKLPAQAHPTFMPFTSRGVPRESRPHTLPTRTDGCTEAAEEPDPRCGWEYAPRADCGNVQAAVCRA